MKIFEPIIGSWKTSGKVLEDGTAITGNDQYEWVSGNAFILHRVNVQIGDEHVQSVEMIGRTEEESQYIFRSFEADGKMSLMHGHQQADGSIRTEGNGMRSTLYFDEPNQTMHALWDKQDGEKWLPWMEMKFTH